MKKQILSIILLFSILISANAKSLVVFYSLTGTTKAMAERIAEETVVPFCTYWSTGNKETLKAIGDLSSSKKVKEGLSQVHGEKADIKKWIKKIGL